MSAHSPPETNLQNIGPRSIPDDVALMEAIRDRDPVALESLYKKYAPVVLALTARMTGDRSVAEELTVDVFAELWERADRYDARRGSPLGHVLGLTRSRAVDRLRKDRALKRRPAEADRTPSRTLEGIKSSSASDPAAGAELSEQRQRVTLALDQLPADERQALELAFFDALSHSEVASRLGQPLGTIKSRIRRGLQQLRELLSPAEETTR